MSTQALLANLLVLAAALYALWVLMPTAWRRPLAKRWALALGWPEPAQPAGGCGSGCGGCGSGTPPAQASSPRRAVITVHRRSGPPPG